MYLNFIRLFYVQLEINKVILSKVCKISVYTESLHQGVIFSSHSSSTLRILTGDWPIRSESILTTACLSVSNPPIGSRLNCSFFCSPMRWKRKIRHFKQKLWLMSHQGILLFCFSIETKNKNFFVFKFDAQSLNRKNNWPYNLAVFFLYHEHVWRYCSPSWPLEAVVSRVFDLSFLKRIRRLHGPIPKICSTSHDIPGNARIKDKKDSYDYWK